MTKKKVAEALRRAGNADADGALSALAGVTNDFVKKRLQPLIGLDGLAGAPARVLWSRLGLKPPIVLRDGDTAPVPAEPAPPAPRPALYLHGDLEGREDHELRFVKPRGTGFPGTLVAFELPLDAVADHDALIDTIREKAYLRTPQATSKSWLILDDPPPAVARFAVDHLTENTIEAEQLARDELQRRILARTSVALDFRGIEVCTQSFLHALLYETLRLAWAMQVEVYATNASPAVVSGLKLVENYALAG